MEAIPQIVQELPSLPVKETRSSATDRSSQVHSKDSMSFAEFLQGKANSSLFLKELKVPAQQISPKPEMAASSTTGDGFTSSNLELPKDGTGKSLPLVDEQVAGKAIELTAPQAMQVMANEQPSLDVEGTTSPAGLVKDGATSIPSSTLKPEKEIPLKGKSSKGTNFFNHVALQQASEVPVPTLAVCAVVPGGITSTSEGSVLSKPDISNDQAVCEEKTRIAIKMPAAAMPMPQVENKDASDETAFLNTLSAKDLKISKKEQLMDIGSTLALGPAVSADTETLTQATQLSVSNPSEFRPGHSSSLLIGHSTVQAADVSPIQRMVASPNFTASAPASINSPNRLEIAINDLQTGSLHVRAEILPDGSVGATLVTSTAEAHTSLSNSVAKITDSLSEQSIHISSLTVVYSSATQDRPSSERGSSPQASHSFMHDETGRREPGAQADDRRYLQQEDQSGGSAPLSGQVNRTGTPSPWIGPPSGWISVRV